MREPSIIADEIDALFEQCKLLLAGKPVQHNEMINALFKLGDLRRELTKMIGEEETLKITSRAYQEVFSTEFLQG